MVFEMGREMALECAESALSKAQDAGDIAQQAYWTRVARLIQEA